MPPPILCHPATYLTALREAPEGKRVQDILAELGIFCWTLSRWRQKVAGFKDEERQIKARKRKLRSEPAKKADAASAAAHLAAARQRVAAARAQKRGGERLEKRFEHFLAVMDAQDDRAAALRETGLSWEEIQDYGKTSPAFSRRYTAILDRWRLAVEDATMRSGAGGDMAAARMYLQAHDPLHFTPRLKVNHHHDVQVTAAGAAGQRPWLDRFHEPPIIEGQVIAERSLPPAAAEGEVMSDAVQLPGDAFSAAPPPEVGLAPEAHVDSACADA